MVLSDRPPSSIKLLQSHGQCVDGFITGGIVYGVESTRTVDGKQFQAVHAGLMGAGHFCGARLNIFGVDKSRPILVEVGGSTMWSGRRSDPSYSLDQFLTAIKEVSAKVPCVRPDLVKAQLTQVALAWDQSPDGLFQQYITGAGGSLPVTRPPQDDPKTVGPGARSG